ncbi:7SK snRNA methylphosphate capping enzyme [Genypterus blacodes]|uniref:7SK snRNA methylphosphate capping enzyme n=1 Tax=Genypterus blacodes TaxID=154954 RepID=UPI003F76C423
MIKMSLDKETVLPLDRTLQEVPLKVSPTFSAGVSLSDQPKVVKTHPLRPKNGLQPAGNNQAPPASAPNQRMGKRRYSLGVGFKGLAKRRRRANSESQTEHTLPSHFLLGGNIFDPLNLNSLLDEEVNRVTNLETPKCSPLPSRGGDPVEILVPRDITDPLNLKGGTEGRDDGGGVLISPLKTRKRHRNRHHGGGEGVERARGGAADGGRGGGGGGEKEAVPARLFPSTTGPRVPLLTREGSVPVSPLPCELNTAITCRDDVAPPPILPRRHTHPPPSHTHKPRNQGEGRQRRRRRTTSVRSSECTANNTIPSAVTQPTRFQTPLVGGAKASRFGGLLPSSTHAAVMKKDRQRYQYGNHNRYYGYQGFYGDKWEGRVGAEEDPRLRLLEAVWFRDKHVLDIGCGAGHIALAIARRFGPAHILGVDRDERLVHAAKQNIRHFLSCDLVVDERRRKTETVKEERREKEVMEEEIVENKVEEKMETEVLEEFQKALSLLSFPLSFRGSRGPLSAPPLLIPAPPQRAPFPNNISFIQGDYVSERGEVWPGRGQYDVILCLGVTKWVQLQSADVGMVKLFKRAYHSLSQGGMFILEPQPWSSYSRSKRASETMYRNYRSLRLKPEQFTRYLTESVGFTSYRLLTHSGNQRPVYLFHKGSTQRK